MSDDHDDGNPPDAQDPKDTKGEPGSYKVGFGKPPVGPQFKPGQSGNPAGRKKGSKNRPKPELLGHQFWRFVSEDAAGLVPLNTAEGQQHFTRVEAMLRAVFATGMKGRVSAQRLYLETTSRAAAERQRQTETEIEDAWRYKDQWTQELARRKMLRLELPDPPVHPDQIEINLVNGRVRINGPIDAQERAVWPRLERMRAEIEAALEELEAQRDDPDCPDRDPVVAEIEGAEAALTVVEAAFDHHPNALDLLAGLKLPKEYDV